MKLTLISDTHMRHEELGTLSGEVLVHCGDMFDLFQRGPDDLANVDAWFSRQRFDLILCIAGNHDHILENGRFPDGQPFRNAVYLEEQTHVHKGVSFYGTPWVPLLKTHAFYADEKELKERWSRIPDRTDVLLTHTPPAGLFDRSSRGLNLGCSHLAKRVARMAPTLHCFGHVHASAGMQQIGATTYVNASSVETSQSPLRRPVQIELQAD